jgi:hypothetical protein
MSNISRQVCQAVEAHIQFQQRPEPLMNKVHCTGFLVKGQTCNELELPAMTNGVRQDLYLVARDIQDFQVLQ